MDPLKNGGIVSTVNPMARYVEPQIGKAPHRRNNRRVVTVVEYSWITLRNVFKNRFIIS